MTSAVVVFSPRVANESPMAIQRAMGRAGALPSFQGKTLVCAVCLQPLNGWTNGQLAVVKARKPTDGGYLAHAACVASLGGKSVSVMVSELEAI